MRNHQIYLFFKDQEMQIKLATPFVPISWGELLDKITILEIKDLKISTTNAKENIRKELKYLLDIANLNNMPEEIMYSDQQGSGELIAEHRSLRLIN